MQVNLAVTHFPPQNCLIEMYKMAVFFFFLSCTDPKEQTLLKKRKKKKTLMQFV